VWVRAGEREKAWGREDVNECARESVSVRLQRGKEKCLCVRVCAGGEMDPAESECPDASVPFSRVIPPGTTTVNFFKSHAGPGSDRR